jgi:hypothetical protein
MTPHLGGRNAAWSGQVDGGRRTRNARCLMAACFGHRMQRGSVQCLLKKLLAMLAKHKLRCATAR